MTRKVSRLVAALALALLVFLAVLLCVANPTLIWFVLVGIALALIYWLPASAIAAILSIGFGLLFVFVIIALSTFSCSIGPSPSPPESHDVLRLAQARYDTDREGWAISETLTISDDALAASAEVLRPTSVDASGRSTLPRDEQVKTLTTWLAGQGWAPGQQRNGQAVFVREGFVPGAIRVVPLRTKQSLGVAPVEVGGFVMFLTAGEGSTLELVAPTGVVVSTEPPSDPEEVPDGELWKIDLHRGGLVSASVAIETASPIARYEPLRSLPDIAEGNLPGYLLAGAFAIGLGMFKEQAQSVVRRVFGGRRPTSGGNGSKPPDDSDSAPKASEA